MCNLHFIHIKVQILAEKVIGGTLKRVVQELRHYQRCLLILIKRGAKLLLKFPELTLQAGVGCFGNKQLTLHMFQLGLKKCNQVILGASARK